MLWNVPQVPMYNVTIDRIMNKNELINTKLAARTVGDMQLLKRNRPFLISQNQVLNSAVI